MSDTENTVNAPAPSEKGEPSFVDTLHEIEHDKNLSLDGKMYKTMMVTALMTAMQLDLLQRIHDRQTQPFIPRRLVVPPTIKPDVLADELDTPPPRPNPQPSGRAVQQSVPRQKGGRSGGAQAGT